MPIGISSLLVFQNMTSYKIILTAPLLVRYLFLLLMSPFPTFSQYPLLRFKYRNIVVSAHQIAVLLLLQSGLGRVFDRSVSTVS